MCLPRRATREMFVYAEPVLAGVSRDHPNCLFLPVPFSPSASSLGVIQFRRARI
jgi:hypothetical protein